MVEQVTAPDGVLDTTLRIAVCARIPMVDDYPTEAALHQLRLEEQEWLADEARKSSTAVG
jgi:hypothetical protein